MSSFTLVSLFELVLYFSGATYLYDDFECFDNVELSSILGNQSVVDFGLSSIGIMATFFEF